VCGIAGFTGDYDRDLLERMATSIAHRGPDDSGFWWEPEARIGLTHRRLSIIDLSPAGHQPMWDADRRAVISYNGELYNYRELRKDLESDGFRFRSHSDTEVLLNLFLRDGMEMLPQLNGIFAFAIWDASKRSLFLARDPLGVKPLYWTQTQRGVLFASELKALLQAPDVDRTLDLASIDYHLHYLWCPSPHTMLRGVHKLEPGHALALGDGRVERQWRYWHLPYDQPVVPISAEAAARAVHDQVERSVHRQMVADVPVGAFLSGGLDSSAVVAFARDAAKDRALHCFTIGFRDELGRTEGMGADLPYAKRVAAHLGVDLDTVWVGPEMIEQLPRMLYHLDEPQGDPAPINALLICQLAREYGMKVLLSGAGGDDLFTGYRRHWALAQERWWSWLPSSLRRPLARSAERLPVAGSLTRRIGKALQWADLDGDERLASYFYWAPPRTLASLYGEALREASSRGGASAPLRAALAELPADTPALHRMLLLEGRFFLTDHNLNYTDKMAMASGVEVRVPLIDPDLVALAARLPPALKQRGRTGKWIFKKAMEPLLPKDVIYRPKTGFGAPIRHWLRHELRPIVDDVLSEPSLGRRGLFDPLAVQELVARDRAGQVDAAYAIFGLVCIELWCRMFVDSPTPRCL